MNTAKAEKEATGKTVAVKHDAGKRQLSLITAEMAEALLSNPVTAQPVEPNIKTLVVVYMELHKIAHITDLQEFRQRIVGAIRSSAHAIGGRKALELTTVAMEYGIVKYERNNWKKGMEWSRLLDAAMRHLLDYIFGEEIDEPSGNPHLAHYLGSLHMLLGNIDMNVGKNDLF